MSSKIKAWWDKFKIKQTVCGGCFAYQVDCIGRCKESSIRRGY